jgi:hypothetical protein
MAYLILVGGPKVNTVHAIHPDGCKVGRGMASSRHLSIERDQHISRRGGTEAKRMVSVGEVGHAEISPEAGAWYVRDIESENGVFVVDGEHLVQLVEGGSKKLCPATLLECGLTPILFMDLKEPPTAEFVKAATRKDGPVQRGGDLSHPPKEGKKSTLPLESPESEELVLMLRWNTIRAAMKQHGYGHLL